MANKDLTEVGKDIVKKKPRGGGRNSPVIGDNGMLTEPGDNSRFLGFTMAVGNLPEIDIRNIGQVQERIQTYFTMCYENDMKPAVSGLALALGISRQMLWSIKTGQPFTGRGYVANVPNEVANSIKKGYDFMENLWENYMQNGKINPVSGIFLGKNNYGYQDKTEYVVTPNVNQDSDYDADEIKKRYLPEGND